jgi:hypothetical protein
MTESTFTPFASHPGNSTLDIRCFPLQLKDYRALISVYISAMDIGHYLALTNQLAFWHR